MSARHDLDAGTQSALVALILIAFIALGYSLLHASPAMEREMPRVARAPAPTPAPEPVPVPVPQPRLRFPLAGFEHALRDNFNERRGVRMHHALDLMAPRGTPVLAVDDGRIAKLYRGPLAGISIYQFDANDSRVYFYAHLDRYAPSLAEGATVKRGDVIGYVGSTGNAPSHAPHLHFSVHLLGDDKRWWRGRPINPYEMLRQASPRQTTP